MNAGLFKLDGVNTLSKTPPRLRLVASTKECALDGHNVEALFHRYSRYVAVIAFRIMGNAGDADDIVQDVFLEAVRRIDRLREPEAVRGWLATTTVRIAKRKLRRQRFLRLVHLDSTDDYLQITSRDACPELQTQVATIYRVLEGVATKHRTAWTLRRIDGRSLAETADLCECSLASAKRWIAVVDRAMREHLDG